MNNHQTAKETKMANPHVLALGNNQWDTFLGPSPSYANTAIDFYGTDPAQPPGVELGTAATVVENLHADWSFYDVIGNGSPGHEAYGSVTLFPSSGTVDLVHGVHLSRAEVGLRTSDGGGYVLNGASTVTNNSYLTAYGGRYQADTFTLKGSLTVANSSIANFNEATFRVLAPSI
jgi:hypothetical protein